MPLGKTQKHTSFSESKTSSLNSLFLNMFLQEEKSLIFLAQYWPKRTWFSSSCSSIHSSSGVRFIISLSSLASSDMHSKIGHMVTKKEILKSLGLSDQVVGTLLDSHNSVTRMIYQNVWPNAWWVGNIFHRISPLFWNFYMMDPRRFWL